MRKRSIETTKPFEAAQSQITAYDKSIGKPVSTTSFTQNRAKEISRKNDKIKDFSIGLQDLDGAIIYYFNNTIKPQVFQDGEMINVPIIYGSPEKWKSFQADGYYRDLQGRIMAPLIMFKRNTITKDRSLNKMINNGVFTSEIRFNWNSEQDFIQGADHFRYGGYFKKCLEDYAESFGVENKEDFELERISESMINIAKKKYICHITYEDGIPYERLNYIYPKGVELVRSSTPAFAREKIVHIVKYLFSHPDTFNIKDLLKLVKGLRKEFELADIDDICMQSSVSKYETKVLEDTKLPLQFVSGAHFAVKSAAHYNYLLMKSKDYQQKYEFIKSGTKIKYYCCKDISVTDMFAYIRGSYPMEFAPPIDYDEQFAKSILSPVNSIIEPLGMPEITKRLSVVMDIFGGKGGF